MKNYSKDDAAILGILFAAGALFRFILGAETRKSKSVVESMAQEMLDKEAKLKKEWEEYKAQTK